MKICHIFIFTEDIENTFIQFEDIHLYIFLAKVHERQTLPGEFIQFLTAESLPLYLNQLSPVRSDFHETLQGVSTGESSNLHKIILWHVLSKWRYRTDFLNLQTKLEPLIVGTMVHILLFSNSTSQDLETVLCKCLKGAHGWVTWPSFPVQSLPAHHTWYRPTCLNWMRHFDGQYRIYQMKDR